MLAISSEDRLSHGSLDTQSETQDDGDTSNATSSHQAAPVIPVAHYPPTAKDWDNHRRIFTKLYRGENKTLEQVMEIMRAKYGFKAT